MSALSNTAPLENGFELRQTLRSRLAGAEALAKAGKLSRVLHNPWKYLSAQWHRHVLYAYTKQGRRAFAKTIFGVPMEIMLPAGMDIYLLGAKGHDSEIRLARLMIEQIKPGDTVLDVGAHFGFFSGLASTLVGKQGRLIAIEPASATFDVLAHNLSGFEQAEALHLAVSDVAGTLTFTEFPLEFSEYNTLRPAQFEGASWLAKNPPRQVHVEVRSVDQILGDSPVSFIKVDVEGAEDACVRSMQQVMSRANPPLLCLEYLAPARENTSHLVAVGLLMDQGFMPHEITREGGLRPTSLADVNRQLAEKGEDSCNLVFKRK